ncbi:MAG TPA: tetratricopeptide repeat protein, partial [Edaphobacter sp.]|nr:tetratricopeptide repeat protein [Edaphobacter sp.]
RGQVYTATPKSLRKSLHGSIANLLLADPADADDLETAWHCVRSGRVDEARPRIISGAQACIERGALHEAELGLRSGLYLLNGEDRLSGMMLIAEVLQEQGQWRDTLGVLAEIQDELAQPTTAPRWRQISAALSARSRSRLESIPAFEVGEVVERLLRGLPSDADNKTAALTASACAATVAYERDADLAATTLTRLDQIRPSDWPLMELGRWLLSRAILSYYAGRINECTEAISEAATRLKVEVNPSSLAAEILLGLGALGCAKGEYAEAVTHLMRAADLAKRIGNDTLYCSATTNLALCHGRLKHFEAQIAWAKLALANGRFQGAYNRLQCLYNLARGHAALGHEGEALNAVSALAAASLDSAPVYVDQARYLFCAEANALLARSGQAERFSVLGVEGRNAKLHSASFAGLYARGLVRAQHHVGDAEVRTRLEALIKKMGSYDLPDQEEIREAYLRLFGKTCDT